MPQGGTIEYLALVRPLDLDALGMGKVLAAISSLTVSIPGAERCRRVRPFAERSAVDAALERQWSFFRLLETADALPLQPFPDVREALALAAHAGTLLPGDRLVEIRTVLRQTHAMQRFLRPRVAEFPALVDLPALLHPLPELERALTAMLDDAGSMLDDASPELADLRRSLRDLRQEIEERLTRLVEAGGDAVADQYVTVRNNRFVVPVKAGAAPRLGGVVQDRSASGETFFVEPLFAIELNNRLLLLAKAEELEVLRLLGLLTEQVGTVRHEIATSLGTLAEIDRLAAGALFARRFACIRPRVGDGVDLRRARHPGLLLAGQTVVPVDVRLPDGLRALVVSGPNTGGKTVALKTLGLLTALALSGVLIPADEGSVVPFVTGLFTDLADAQSIERNLSTFSAHVSNLVDVFRSVGPPGLVLLDEPGAGTDPEEGAALAVAVVDRLIAAGVLVAVSTHYTPVKLWALQHPAVQLAAVDIDRQTFEPRYRILYGSVGESLGLAMARRLALPTEVLETAEARMTATGRELAAAIGRLEDERRRFENERGAAAEERAALAELEREHSALVAELRERRRTRWSAELDEARAFVRALKTEGRALLEIVRRRDPDATSRLGTFMRDAAAAIDARASSETPPAAETSAPTPPAVGDTVEVTGTTIRGELTHVAGEDARVQRGTLTFRVRTAQLRRLGAPEEPARDASRLLARGNAPSELRVVGLRVRDALASIEHFLDRAQGSGLQSVRIVHGLGTGALKRAIVDYLRRSPYCASFADADPGFGGAGVTVVEML